MLEEWGEDDEGEIMGESGKKKCALFREICKQIAQRNDIPFAAMMAIIGSERYSVISA